MVASLFLAWGVAGSLNDVLVRQFQKALALNRTQSSLIQFAFYVGYFCAALPAGLVIRRFGYKRAILAGLSLYAVGAMLFYPAAELERFSIFLAALYVIAIGLAFLETAANPYVSILGAPQTAASRLNLAQSFWCVGATLGPLIGGRFIFSGIEHSPAELAAMSAANLAAYRSSEAHMVQAPYLVVAGLVILLAVAIGRTPFPVLAVERTGADVTGRRPIFAVLRHRQLRYAVLAQFAYTGAQIAILSFFIDFTKAVMPHMPERTTAFFLSSSLALMFLGRLVGVVVQRKMHPARLLFFFCCGAMMLCAAAILTHGVSAIASLWGTAFFMSVIFPTVFSLGVTNLGDETGLGASYLIMSVIGAALIPPLTGLVSDWQTGIQKAMTLPLVCLAVCAGYALAAPRLIAADGAQASRTAR
jgi:FHS family L-fucose permease-like MFS transporter